MLNFFKDFLKECLTEEERLLPSKLLGQDKRKTAVSEFFNFFFIYCFWRRETTEFREPDKEGKDPHGNTM